MSGLARLLAIAAQVPAEATRFASSAPDGRPLLPPRPIRGPVPWPRTGADPEGLGETVALLLTVAVGALVAGGLLLRAWRARRRSTRGPSRAEAVRLLTDAGPTDQPLVASRLIRSALESRFGPSWAARTTQELAASPEIATALGADGLEAFNALFESVDRSKFGHHEPRDRAGGGCEPERILEWLEALSRASAGQRRGPVG